MAITLQDEATPKQVFDAEVLARKLARLPMLRTMPTGRLTASRLRGFDFAQSFSSQGALGQGCPNKACK